MHDKSKRNTTKLNARFWKAGLSWVSILYGLFLLPYILEPYWFIMACLSIGIGIYSLVNANKIMVGLAQLNHPIKPIEHLSTLFATLWFVMPAWTGLVRGLNELENTVFFTQYNLAQYPLKYLFVLCFVVSLLLVICIHKVRFNANYVPPSDNATKEKQKSKRKHHRLTDTTTQGDDINMLHLTDMDTTQNKTKA